MDRTTLNAIIEKEYYNAGAASRDEEFEKLKTLLKKLYEDKHEPDKLYIYWPEVKKALKDFR